MLPATHERTPYVMRTVRHSTSQLVHYLASQLLFERRLKMDTTGTIATEELGIRDTDGLRSRYEPSPWLSLRSALRVCKVTPGDVFIDLGSGKGRVVLQAAEYPFKRVLGVELSPSSPELPGPTCRRTASA